MTQGLAIDIQRMSTEDGPGIRTTVFLKGCSLRCSWCQNPESVSPRPELRWNRSKCVGCGACVEKCPSGALQATAEGICMSQSDCVLCWECVSECPSGAMERLGQEWDADELVQEVAKDKAYFTRSGGGVTISGGEPTLQPLFVASALKGCRDMGVHTAVETCGNCSQEALGHILPHCDLLLFDLKEADSERHKSFTGAGNERILHRLDDVRAHMTTHGTPRDLWIRTPMIPRATARDDNIEGIAKLILDHAGALVGRWELCAFNNLCEDKYLKAGMKWAFANMDLMPREQMEQLAETARASGVDPNIVCWSGLTLDSRGD